MKRYYTYAIRKNGKLSTVTVDEGLVETFPIVTYTPRNFGMWDSKEGAQARLRMSIDELRQKIRNKRREITRVKNNTPKKFSINESQRRIADATFLITKITDGIKRLETDIKVVRVKKIRVPRTVYDTKFIVG